jgi:Uma2 family endonuclease
METEEANIVREPIANYGDLNLNKLYTYWDYLNFQFAERVELIRGKILKMAPGPTFSHQKLSGSVHLKFYSLFKDKTKCQIIYAPFDVKLPIPKGIKDSTVVQPDLIVVCDESKLDERCCNGAPDLVVEILSKFNQKHDLHTKFDLYEEAGVKEYWIADMQNKSILVYTLKDGKYIGLRPFAEDMNVESVLFPFLSFNVGELFDF